jgi:glycerol-3-phosphate acyltransferase PlsY
MGGVVDVLRVASALALAYLLGSLPFGVLVSGLWGRDPRIVGSGRTGGTNVYRTAGLPAAVLTVLLDTAKGLAAVVLASWLVPEAAYGSGATFVVSLAALAAIIGHNHSAFLGFKGGAGTAPNLGAALALDPRVFVAALAAGALGLVVARVAAVASIIASAVICLAFAWRVIDAAAAPSLLVYAVGQLVLVLWALRPNIARLRAGTERKISGRRPESAGAAER